MIGNAFSLDVGSFMLTVGGKAVDGTFDKETNTWTFGEKEDGSPRFQVVYDSEAKTFTWDIGENVTNFARVQLSYTVKLDKPETAAGTYGVKDLDGDKYVDGTETPVDPDKALYTNESAVLVPVNSNNEQGEAEIFPQPSVAYEVKGGGGTIITPVKPDPKPDPEPPTDIDDGNTPADPGSDIDEPETPTTPAEPPKTGDMMPLFAGVAAVSAAAIALLGRKRKEA